VELPNGDLSRSLFSVGVSGDVAAGVPGVSAGGVSGVVVAVVPGGVAAGGLPGAIADPYNDIPSQHVCPIIFEPPFMGVHFNVSNLYAHHVFERSAIFRHIATPGAMLARRNVLHPITKEMVPRDSAWNFVRCIDPVLQETLHRERLALGLPLEDADPINDNDRALYEQTMVAIRSR
jgi:hypothetical protein